VVYLIKFTTRHNNRFRLVLSDLTGCSLKGLRTPTHNHPTHSLMHTRGAACPPACPCVFSEAALSEKKPRRMCNYPSPTILDTLKFAISLFAVLQRRDLQWISLLLTRAVAMVLIWQVRYSGQYGEDLVHGQNSSDMFSI